MALIKKIKKYLNNEKVIENNLEKCKHVKKIWC